MFSLLFSNVALMLVYMMIGFCLCKTKLMYVAHAKSMSTLLIYVLGPCMIINSFLQLEYNSDTLLKISKYFVVSLIMQMLFFGILFLIFGKKYEDSRYRILSAGGVLGNVGFIGMPIVASVFPNDPIVQCYSSMNVMSMNIIIFTIGVYMITNDKKYVSPKGVICNPTTVAIFIALPLYLLQVNFPVAVMNSVGLLGKMVTPMCMIILGMRLSASDIKGVFTRPFVYGTCLLKLIVFPVFAYLLVSFLPFLDNISKATIIVLAATPSAAVIESLAEVHECEQEFAANVVLLTTILSVVTIPIMMTILL